MSNCHTAHICVCDIFRVGALSIATIFFIYGYFTGTWELFQFFFSGILDIGFLGID